MRASAQTSTPHYFDEESSTSEQPKSSTDIARDIHDRVGPGLSALGHSLEDLYEQGSADREDIFVLHKKVSDLQLDLRQILSELRGHETVDQLNVYSVMKNSASHMTESLQMDVVFCCQNKRTLAGSIEHEFAQIANEALNNIMMHSQATQVKMFWSCGEDYAALEIADNGKGFSMETSQPGRFGIVGMRERAMNIGANINLTSTREEGTVLTCTLEKN